MHEEIFSFLAKMETQMFSKWGIASKIAITKLTLCMFFLADRFFLFITLLNRWIGNRIHRDLRRKTSSRNVQVK